ARGAFAGDPQGGQLRERGSGARDVRRRRLGGGAGYLCPSTPSTSAVQGNGQLADGVAFGVPVRSGDADFTQAVTFAHSGTYVVHVLCEGYDMPSETITVTDPAETTTDWIFPTTTADGGGYDDPARVLLRDGLVAHSEVGNGRITLRGFPGTDLPVGSSVRKVEIRSHLGGDRTTIGFDQHAPTYAQCTDHNDPTRLLHFDPYSETTVDDYLVGYTSLDCPLHAEAVSSGSYEVVLQGYFTNSIYNIDDVSVRFTYTAPVPTVAVSPGAGLAGSLFTATYQCRSTTPVLSVVTSDGRPATDAVIDSPTTTDHLNYTQGFRLNAQGTDVVHVTCGSAHLTSSAITVHKPLKYIALGDSYSSGEGNPPYDLSDACHRSSLGWPTRVAGANRDRITSSANVACSGATTKGLTQEEKKQNPQLDTIRTGQPDVVTVTIGGNDVDFAGYIRWCVLFSCVHKLDAEAADISELVRFLPSVYTGIRNAAGSGARIIVVGYPRLFPQFQSAVRCTWLSDAERAKLNALAVQLDQGLASAAAQAGLEYVSTLEALDGHEMCSDRTWMNPISLDPGAAHPNSDGQQAVADAVIRKMAL
ncbi:SGNH/GDSL hydrolase family protein, partial [Actinosynnema sp. NPDC023658]|uniref:SGNH/GDSL hydrolase family protein n=1 Tax=Actinosynnema sp. NPDC023658 TaxID=3155465 RepID=UPI0033DF55AC